MGRSICYYCSRRGIHRFERPATGANPEPSMRSVPCVPVLVCIDLLRRPENLRGPHRVSALRNAEVHAAGQRHRGLVVFMASARLEGRADIHFPDISPNKNLLGDPYRFAHAGPVRGLAVNR